jgi:hypothetical protein
MTAKAPTPIRVVFKKTKEGADKIHYREIHPGGVVGSHYLSKLAIHYAWNGDVPDVIEMYISPVASATIEADE